MNLELRSQPEPLAQATEEPFYLPSGDEVSIFEQCHARDLAVMLKGPTGCGKTRFVEYMAWRLGRPLVTISCHDDLTASDLVGRFLIHREGIFWQDGPLTRAVREGAICYLDEVVEARQDTVVVLHSLADHRRMLSIDKTGESVALQSLGEPYAIEAFSGEGPQRVTSRTLKRFDEPYGPEIALRIAGLEPERYTRAGAAIRHASSLLMHRRAHHRLLLLLSDGKPNDVDEYEGRYGAEDMRQAVIEAKLQGISPFCLTIDRHAANYLPRVFGANQYALLAEPERLPTVLVEWMRRLIVP